MSNAAATISRWTGDEMQKRVARRYKAERRFRFFGLAAIGISVAFLAFLLVTMAWKGIGGFTQTEAKLTIDFARSDLFIEEATLRGPQAQEAVATAGLDGVLEQAAVASPTLAAALALCQEHRPELTELARLAAVDGIAAHWRSKIEQRLAWLRRETDRPPAPAFHVKPEQP